MAHKITLYLCFIFSMLIAESVFSQSLYENNTPVENIEGLSIYPNPVSNGKVYIITKGNFNKEVEIYNVLGKRILKKTLTSKELNIAQLKAGVYIIKVTEKNIAATRKLIIK
ncbi:T9SS type A sorting domain-containing protein [Corallibacter vietnamensis]|uniref:T9SS type A sorting domain-containing protein n=1 Tax=Corallibacter vietnamensis TaxID=904130 RepID=A0ABP7GSV6_9FLAO